MRGTPGKKDWQHRWNSIQPVSPCQTLCYHELRRLATLGLTPYATQNPRCKWPAVMNMAVVLPPIEYRIIRNSIVFAERTYPTTANPLFTVATNSIAVFAMKSSISSVRPGKTPIQKTLLIT